jgi:hypothetical protein
VIFLTTAITADINYENYYYYYYYYYVVVVVVVVVMMIGVFLQSLSIRSPYFLVFGICCLLRQLLQNAFHTEKML